MAIQPIDLQTLYTQLDKIGKSQVQQQAAAQAVHDEEMAANKADAEQRMKSVNESEAGDEKAGRVHERDGSGKQEEQSAKGSKAAREKESESDDKKEEPKEVIRDPALGKHIDISG